MTEKEIWKKHILEGIKLIQRGCSEKDPIYCFDCPLCECCLEICKSPLHWDIKEE